MRYVLMEKAKQENRAFLIWDVGPAVDHALRLVKDGNRVLYFTEWADSSPKFNKYVPGLGYEGLTKVKNFFNFVDKVDCVCFFYIGRGDLCSWLRGEGYTCFGAGMGERLEKSRSWAKKIQKEIGLPVQSYKLINGVDNVISYLKKNPGKYIKLDIFRGDLETFFAEDAESAEAILNPMKVKLGPYADSFEFMVEDKVQDVVVETGWDLFFNGRNFLKPYLWNYLYRGIYMGRYSEVMPKPLMRVMNAIKPILIGLDYRGAISCEVLITKKGEPYLLDLTTRIPYPSGIQNTYSLNNYSEVIWKVAKGEDVALDVKNEYVGALDLESPYVMSNWAKVSYPPELSDKIRIQGARYEDSEYVIPQEGYPLFAELITCKGSVKDAMADLKKMSTKVSCTGYESKIDEDAFYKVVSAGRSVGLNF